MLTEGLRNWLSCYWPAPSLWLWRADFEPVFPMNVGPNSKERCSLAALPPPLYLPGRKRTAVSSKPIYDYKNENLNVGLPSGGEGKTQPLLSASQRCKHSRPTGPKPIPVTPSQRGHDVTGLLHGNFPNFPPAPSGMRGPALPPGAKGQP